MRGLMATDGDASSRQFGQLGWREHDALAFVVATREAGQQFPTCLGIQGGESH